MTNDAKSFSIDGVAAKAGRSSRSWMGARMLAGSARRPWLPALVGLVALAGCSREQGAGPQTVEGQLPVATVEMSQVQAAYIGSASGGSGELFFNSRTYPFTVGGIGIGGIGASTIEATGDVYKLKQSRDFEGEYVQGRYGFALGTTSGGDLWLTNQKGVVMHLRAKRTGLMLSLGGDVVVVTFKPGY